MDVPGQYRGLPSDAQTQTAGISLGNQKWWDVFQDPSLRDLIKVALKENYDVRIAAQRILEARAVLGITRADQYPNVSATTFPLNWEKRTTCCCWSLKTKSGIFSPTLTAVAFFVG